MSEPVEVEYIAQMNEMARLLDKFFNGNAVGKNKKTCFVLLIAGFGDSKRCNYISNGERLDCISMMKEVIARFEGQPHHKIKKGKSN